MKTTNYFLLPMLLMLSSLFFSRSACGQDSISHLRYFSIGHDNDFVNIGGSGTDEYYTGGFYLRYAFLNSSRKNVLRKILYAPGKPDYSFFSIGLTFWMYTPVDLETAGATKGDYPYSGTLFLGLSRETSFGRRKLFRSELWLGTVGPSAQAQQIQKLIHRYIHAITPEGWENQLPDYPVINYNLYFESNLASLNPAIQLNGVVQTQTGSLMNTAQAGFKLAVSNVPYDFFPARIYTRDKENSGRTLKIYLEIHPAVKFVATNSLLQGGLFAKKDRYHISDGDLERLLFEGAGTIGIRTRRFSLAYQQVYETRQFRTVHAHSYGSLVISMAF